MNRKSSIALAAVVMGVTAAALPASAAGAATSVTPSISLSTVAGAKSVSPTLGSKVTYNTTFANSTKNPYVMTVCYQNGVAVYIEGEQPGGTFTLGGSVSQWLTNGGSANCSAWIQSATWKGGVETITILASTSFVAGA